MTISKASSFAIALFFAFGGFLTMSQSVLAVEGTCSWHGGVDCGAGADWDGSAICADGWRDSSERFYMQNKCNLHHCSTAVASELRIKYRIDELYQAVDKKCDFPAELSSVEGDTTSQLRDKALKSLEFSATCSIARGDFNAALNQYDRECYATGELEYQQLLLGLYGFTRPLLPKTDSECRTSHGQNSVSNGTSCSCKSTYLFDSANQCKPAGDVCIQTYGENSHPISDTTCGCAVGYHMDSTTKKCVEDAKPIKVIPVNVKIWVDENFTKAGTSCSSNSNFSESELRVCEEYHNTFTRRKYDWRTEESAAVVTPAVSPAPVNFAPLSELPKEIQFTSKNKAREEQSDEKVAVIESLTSLPQMEGTTTDKDEVSLDSTPSNKKSFWSKVFKWFKFW